MTLDAKAVDKISKGWYGERIDRSDCEYLLTFRDKSSETNLAASLANRIMRKACSNVGQICAEIEVRNEDFDITDSTLAKYADEIGGFSDVRSIKLTTGEECDIESLCEQIAIVKEHSRRGLRIYVQTRDMDIDECRALKDAGAYGAYHSVRLDIDNGAKRDKRLKTISNLSASGLSVVSGVGPIGPEHELKDLVDAFYGMMECRCSGIEITHREPVPGTKFNQYGKITPARLAQFKAIFTLASSWYVQPTRTAFPGTLVVNQNIVTAKYDSAGKTQLEAARRKLFNSGFDRLLKTDDSTVDLNLMYLRQTGSV